MDLFIRSNDALQSNPLPDASEILSLGGDNWLWAVTAIFLLAFFAVLVPCFTAPENSRVFHYLYVLTLLTGAITYFAQASDLGWSIVLEDDNSTRQVFYVRYIYWTVSFPAAALAFGLLSNLSWTTIFTNIVTVWIWVLTYLAAAYTSSSYKWGFFAFGTFSWMIAAMSTMNEGREAAARIGIGKDYILLAGWLNIVWLVYPIAFALSDGSNVIGTTGAAIMFGVLDILMIPVLSIGFIFVFGKKWNFEKLHLAFSEHRYLPPTPEP